MAKARLPRILADYLRDTEQDASKLSESHLLYEALECWYCMNCGECYDSWGHEYKHPATKAALKRYINRLEAKGVEPRLDYAM